MEAFRLTSERSADRIVLASSSPRRKALLTSLPLKLPVDVLSPDTDERVPGDWAPPQVVEQLALRKAEAVRQRLAQDDRSGTPALVIGADTIVVLDGAVLGKPADAAEARSMLEGLQGRRHEVYTGVALLHTGSGHADVRHRMTRVVMKPLDLQGIERYVASGEPLDKAGSYGIQGIGATLVDSIEGCYFNVVGLPLSLLADMLAPHGIEVP